MTAMEILKQAVESTGMPVYANFYQGEAESYCTINCTEIPASFGDDAPEMIRNLVQVHWFAPYGSTPTQKKRAICAALLRAGCTYPEITDASDETGLHFAFECEYADGNVEEVDEDGEI